MKHLIFVFAIVLCSTGYCADDTKTVMASLITSWVPSYEPEEECSDPAAESGKIVCGAPFYYIYALKPQSTLKAPRSIRVAFSSHSLWLRKSNSLWLLQLKKLDPILAKKLGAEYELINAAQIDGERCAYTSIPLNSWLYSPKFPIVESVVKVTAFSDRDQRGTFCYGKHQSIMGH